MTVAATADIMHDWHRQNKSSLLASLAVQAYPPVSLPLHWGIAFTSAAAWQNAVGHSLTPCHQTPIVDWLNCFMVYTGSHMEQVLKLVLSYRGATQDIVVASECPLIQACRSTLKHQLTPGYN